MHRTIVNIWKNKEKRFTLQWGSEHNESFQWECINECFYTFWVLNNANISVQSKRTDRKLCIISTLNIKINGPNFYLADGRTVQITFNGPQNTKITIYILGNIFSIKKSKDKS